MTARTMIEGTQLELMKVYKQRQDDLMKLSTAQLLDLQHDFSAWRDSEVFTERAAAEINFAATSILIEKRGRP